ncbi:MAG: extracellular solute-binding protein [Phycisphaeraceae bacterium]|nr:MAG: extracellular solute-binding protein [Phycisphaeraceae bacterium]
MALPRIIVGLCLLIILAVPFFFRPDAVVAPEGADRIIIISPHNEQIRYEFGRAFSDWRVRQGRAPVVVDWRRPGGTSEIRRQLESQYRAAVIDGRIGPDGHARPGVMPYDLMLGGGSYEHNQIKRGVSVTVAGDDGPRRIDIPISIPIEISEDRLREIFGENRIGAEPLWDPELHWVATVLSSFGIAYNRDVLKELGLEEPRSWRDLADPRYAGWLGLADPRQSGSVATTYDSILTNHGWDDGWRLLRAMAANARYFSASATRVVIDLAHGEAAAALSIDFYGRYEAQALLRPGQHPDESRVGYIDPVGAVLVDPDPVSMLRGGPHPELALEFIDFLLTHEGQAIWQYPAVGEEAPPGALGPRRFELRRMPARRDMYPTGDEPNEFFDRFIDKVNPFEIASDQPPRGWRPLISPMFATFAIDINHDITRAWRALIATRDSGADAARIQRMEDLFYAMPEHELPDGSRIAFTEENFDTIRADWRNPDREPELRIQYTRFFRNNYREIVRLAK